MLNECLGAGQLANVVGCLFVVLVTHSSTGVSNMTADQGIRRVMMTLHKKVVSGFVSRCQSADTVKD